MSRYRTIVADPPWNVQAKRAGTWPRGVHSAKPDAFVDMVEKVNPGPYLEMFARRARFGWDYWGDESLETASLSHDE